MKNFILLLIFVLFYGPLHSQTRAFSKQTPKKTVQTVKPVDSKSKQETGQEIRQRPVQRRADRIKAKKGTENREGSQRAKNNKNH